MVAYPPKTIILASGEEMPVRQVRREEAGAIEGEIAGIVTSRCVDPDIGISLHTLTVKRGLRVGARLFAAKMEHHLEFLDQQEVWIVAESPIGFRRWMIEYGLDNAEDRCPAVHHGLGVSTKNESVDSLKCRLRCVCSPKTFQTL